MIRFFCLAIVLSSCCVPSLAQETTGYVQVKQIEGVWWFIGPHGDKFVSIGVNHIEPHLWLAPYNKAETLQRYGADMVSSDGQFQTHGSAAKKWINRQLEICRDLGFNTFGKHTHPSISPSLYQREVYYIASLETAPLAGWQQRKGLGPRPDVFSLDFQAFVEKRVQEICDQHKDQRNLIGYLYTDVPSWVLGRRDQMERDDTTMIYPWINAILPLGEASPGKHRWLQHLKGRYENAGAAASAWGLPVSPTYGVSWDRLARHTDWTHPADPTLAKKDMLSFMQVIVEQWYSLHKELIRKHDPNHLILGDKNLLAWHHDWMLPSLKKHVDVICIQAYGRWVDDVKLTDRIHEQTGKPIFNGDGCYGFADQHQQEWGVKGFRTGAKTIEEVAGLYEENLQGMMSTPYMIGWHHCGYLQQWDEAERGDSPRNENGFLDPNENYRQAWTETIRRVNATANQLHAEAQEQRAD